jgi:hypothetical protein
MDSIDRYLIAQNLSGQSISPLAGMAASLPVATLSSDSSKKKIH